MCGRVVATQWSWRLWAYRHEGFQARIVLRSETLAPGPYGGSDECPATKCSQRSATMDIAIPKSVEALVRRKVRGRPLQHRGGGRRRRPSA